jgi:phenylacetate-CoA ligase
MEFGLGQLLQARPKAMRRRIWSALARRAIARAEAFDPEAVARATEARALASFRRTARAVPAYRSLLRESCVDPRQIVTIGDFHRLVPVVSKERLFDSYRLAALVANGRIGDGTLVFTSSGYSGSFSFGVETAQQTSTLTERIDALLDYYFRVCSKRTLIVNALPGGVRIPTRAALVAELGPRPEAVLRVLEGLGSDLEQIVLVAEPLLAKELAEQARERCFDLAGLRVSAIVGGEFVADSFRRYLAPLLGGELFTSFGISELGLSLAHDTAELRRVASALARDRELRSRVLDGAPFAPELLQYYPDQYYLETPELDGRRSLVATTLDPERLLPLVRYRSGDWAEVLPGGALAERLARAGHPELALRSKRQDGVATPSRSSRRCSRTPSSRGSSPGAFDSSSASARCCAWSAGITSYPTYASANAWFPSSNTTGRRSWRCAGNRVERLVFPGDSSESSATSSDPTRRCYGPPDVDGEPRRGEPS